MTDSMRLGELGKRIPHDAKYGFEWREGDCGPQMHLKDCRRCQFESALARLRAEVEMWPHCIPGVIVTGVRGDCGDRRCHRCRILREIE